MGYSCSGVLAVQKSVVIQSKLLKQDLPTLLKEMDEEQNKDIVYYKFEGFKMYSSYPEVSLFYEWLDSLHEIVPKDEHYEHVYAYMEVGEEGETVHELGDTCAFDLYKEHYIDYPMGSTR